MQDLLDKIRSSPELTPYRREFPAGSIIFYEGDNSLDLFVLLRGSVEVRKGHKIIALIEEPGAIFGEMASFLDNRRTATVKTLEQTEVLQIPYDQVDKLKKTFPWIEELISKCLAKKVLKTSDTLYAIEQVCDKIPEAMILTDEKGKIVSFNIQAAKLFEHDSEGLIGKDLHSLFIDCSECANLMERVKREGMIKDQILSFNQKNGERIYLLVSANYNKNPFGSVINYIFLFRDITEQLKKEQKIKLISKIAAILFFLLLPIAIFVGYYYRTTSTKIPNEALKNFEILDELRADAKSLEKSAISGLGPKEVAELTKKIKDILSKKQVYNRIILLDSKQNVLLDEHAGDKGGGRLTKYSPSMIKKEGAPFKVLRLYEATPQDPMGKRVLHIAYRIERNQEVVAWIIFEPKGLEIDERITEFN